MMKKIHKVVLLAVILSISITQLTACGSNTAMKNIETSDNNQSEQMFPGKPDDMPQMPDGDRPPEPPEGDTPKGKPGENPPPKPGEGGSGFGGSREVTNGTSAVTITDDVEIRNQSYTSTGDNENALRVDNANVLLEQISIEKTQGDSSNTEDGDFYGQNAAFLALNGADVEIKNASVNTSVKNGNGIFCYGKGTTVYIYDSKIKTEGNNSGGIQTTGGGTMNVRNLNIETSGNSAAAIRSDRGGGVVTVESGTYTTNGLGSPAVYCTADISVKNANLTANNSEGIVIEGKNSLKLENVTLKGSMKGTYNGDSDENIHGLMIYQSMSGDAEVGKSYFSAKNCNISTDAGDMIYVTNTSCEIELENTDFVLANDIFLRIEGNNSSRGWGKQGSNGGNVVLNASNQIIRGNILVDEISSLDMNISSNSFFEGTINPDGKTGDVNVTLDDLSKWKLTDDAYIKSFTGNAENIESNGHKLYVNGVVI